MKPLILLMFILPCAAMADAGTFANCQFDQECLENESCEKTDFEMTIKYDDTFGFIMQTVAENIEGYVFDVASEDEGTENEESTLIARTETAGHILIIQSDGSADYSVHMQGIKIVSYTGQCEVTQ